MRYKTSLISLVAVLGLVMPSITVHATTDVENNIHHVAMIICGNKVNGDYIALKQGSGVVIGDDGIITNAHVVTDDDQTRFLDWCVGGIAKNAYTAPVFTFELVPTEFARYDDDFDYAFMRAYDVDGNPYLFDSYAALSNGDSMVPGEEVIVMGYPAAGGETITTTTGSVVGYQDSTWIKTDASIDAGSSGGAGFDVAGNLFGLTTGVTRGEFASFSYFQNINAILEDAFGPEIAVRDYDTLYEGENVFCLNESCYQYAEDEATWEDNVDEEDEVVDDEEIEVPIDEIEDVPEETPEEVTPEDDELVYTLPETVRFDSTKEDKNLTSRMKGHILLQVEQHGEAWYVNMNDGLRYYMRDGAIAYQMMRSFGLGITDKDLALIPAVESVDEMKTATSICKTNATANRLRGQILLQVEQHGEAWYVHPDTCRRIYMKDGDVAYSTMRYLSLGITDNDLAKLPYSANLILK